MDSHYWMDVSDGWSHHITCNLTMALICFILCLLRLLRLRLAGWNWLESCGMDLVSPFGGQTKTKMSCDTMVLGKFDHNLTSLENWNDGNWIEGLIQKLPQFQGEISSGWWFGTFFIFHHVWDNPSYWLIFFKMVKTTNQVIVGQQSSRNSIKSYGIPSGKLT